MKIDRQIETKLKSLRLTGMFQTLSVRVKQARDGNNGGRADNSWENRTKRHTSGDLLIIDDFGLKPLTSLQSDDLLVFKGYFERYL